MLKMCILEKDFKLVFLPAKRLKGVFFIHKVLKKCSFCLKNNLQQISNLVSQKQHFHPQKYQFFVPKTSNQTIPKTQPLLIPSLSKSLIKNSINSTYSQKGSLLTTSPSLNTFSVLLSHLRPRLSSTFNVS